MTADAGACQWPRNKVIGAAKAEIELHGMTIVRGALRISALPQTGGGRVGSEWITHPPSITLEVIEEDHTRLRCWRRCVC